MNFWVVSDLNFPELEEFRKQFQGAGTIVISGARGRRGQHNHPDRHRGTSRGSTPRQPGRPRCRP